MILNGAATRNGGYGLAVFSDHSTAGHATIVSNRPAEPGLGDPEIIFADDRFWCRLLPTYLER